MRFRTPLLLLLALTIAPGSVSAQQMPRENVIEVPAIGEGLSLHNLFQSNMVLQRGKPLRVWGWGDPGSKVTLTFADQIDEATVAENRTWSIPLAPLEANSTPQSLTVRSGEAELTLENILVGDVWLLGGQSNMEFPISRVENGALEIASANFPLIRHLSIPTEEGPDEVVGFPRLHEWSSWSSRHFRKGDWLTCTPESVRELSAIGYVFARRLHTATGVPIGIVDVSRGGTTVETWTPYADLAATDSEHVRALLATWEEKEAAWDAEADLENRIKRHNDWVARQMKEGKTIPQDRSTPPSDLRPGPIRNSNRPGSCYAGMIAPIRGLTCTGAIFHQGYNNCFNGTAGALMYRDAFPVMIAAWREAFGDPELPFGILSLCTDGKPQTRENYTAMMMNVGPYIRDAQYQTYLQLRKSGEENVGFVSTYDLSRRWYHPQLKIPAGERIARWALATEYDMDGELRWEPPTLQEMTVAGERVVLKFNMSVAAVDTGGPIEGFAIAGEDRCFHPAEATHLVTGKDNRNRDQYDRTQLVLTSPLVPEPVHFRYAWGRNPLANAQADRHSDVPLATQRSDDWVMEQIPAGIVDAELGMQIDGRQKNALKQALEEEDIKRLVHEALEVLKEHRGAEPE